MPSLHDLQMMMIRGYDAELDDLRQLCDELRALGAETLRIEEIMLRNGMLREQARAYLTHHLPSAEGEPDESPLSGAHRP